MSLDAVLPAGTREAERSKAEAGGLVARRRGPRAPAPLWTAIRYALLVAGALLMLAPFADLVLGSLRTPAESLARPPVYFPHAPQWENFETVFRRFPLALWVFNSFVVTVAITAIQLATSATAGYALAKFEFRGRDTLLKFVIGAQFFPFFLFIIPLFFVLRYWPLVGGNDLFGQGGSGFLNSYAALILPFSVSWYGVFLMRQFMISVPNDLLDAARMDGAGEIRILWSIVLPLVRPALATLGVFVFVYHWNEVVWTLTVTRAAPDLQTAPIGIHLLRGSFENEQDEILQRAAMLITVLPVAVLFLALQRFYVRSLSSGLKGR